MTSVGKENKINMHGWNFSGTADFCFNFRKYIDQIYRMTQQFENRPSASSFFTFDSVFRVRTTSMKL